MYVSIVEVFTSKSAIAYRVSTFFTELIYVVQQLNTGILRRGRTTNDIV